MRASARTHGALECSVRVEGESVQDVIEELIRVIGHVALRVVTAGRYRSDAASRLAEGAIGLGLIVLVAYVVYAVGTR